MRAAFPDAEVTGYETLIDGMTTHEKDRHVLAAAVRGNVELDDVAEELRTGWWRVQAAVKIVLEPIFEAGFLSCSFGFLPKRSAHDALQVLIDESWQGKRWVVETDIANCFTAIPHEKLIQAVEERVSDQAVLKLLRAMLRAGVMQDGQIRREGDCNLTV